MTSELVKPSRTTPQRFGEALRAARENKGWSLAEAADRVKLAPRQLDALESERFEDLPVDAVVRGFVRNYTRALDQDPDHFLALLKEIHASSEPSLAKLTPGVPMRGESLPFAFKRNRFSFVFVTLVCLALAGLAIAGWIALQPQGSRVPFFSKPSGDRAPRGMSVSPLATPSVEPLPAPSISTGEGERTSQAPAEAVVAESAASKALRFLFKDASWVEVRQGDGRIILSQLNPQNTEQTLAGQAPFSVVIGNAPNVRLEYQGRPVDLRPHIAPDSVARITLK